ncbi:hypothetical protein AB0A73_24605 [Glycomyces sp. NPDC047369]
MSVIELGDLPELGRAPRVRPAYRILGRAHASVKGLFGAVSVLDDARRSANPSKKGRMSHIEHDVLRAAIIFTSAGLDASMKRLVRDAGRALLEQSNSSAAKRYQAFLKNELSKPVAATSAFINAVTAPNAADRLIDLYIDQQTESSFQKSGHLKTRVRDALGIPAQAVTDLELESLDEFFKARNKIVHEMDLVDPANSITQNSRAPEDVVAMCSYVFETGARLMRAAASAVKKAGA